MMKNLIVDRINLVGNGRHMRLRLRSGRHNIGAIYFSATPETASIAQGDLVDVAFNPQINEFRGERSVQMNIIDIRPACAAEVCPDLSSYHALRRGQLNPQLAEELLPDRTTLAMVWRYLASMGDTAQDTPMCLCRKIVRWSGTPLSLGKFLTCLDIFADVGLLKTQRLHKHLSIHLTPGCDKADLYASSTMQTLLQAKES
jgi:single-stranded-DNA-specific exonuclease